MFLITQKGKHTVGRDLRWVELIGVLRGLVVDIYGQDIREMHKSQETKLFVKGKRKYVFKENV